VFGSLTAEVDPSALGTEESPGNVGGTTGGAAGSMIGVMTAVAIPIPLGPVQSFAI